MMIVSETSGLSSARQINDSTSTVTFSPNNTSSDIEEIILTLSKKIIKILQKNVLSVYTLN